MNQPTRKRVLSTLLLVALGAIGTAAWQHLQSPPLSPVQPTAQQPDTLAASSATVPTPTATQALGSMAPAIQHPVVSDTADATLPAVALPSLADSDKPVAEGLAELMGRQNLLTFWQPSGFVRHVVATVDNLGRDHAPSLAWPVQPTPGRFTALTDTQGTDTIHPDNRQRYVPLVNMVEAVDTGKAVALYRRLYPLFQQAYEELGFPGRYFNDRLVAVLDLLISTPAPTHPPTLKLVEVKGPVTSLRPWMRYEYADPAWQALPAGQKMLLRIGPDNQRRLVAKLRDIRQRVAKAP